MDSYHAIFGPSQDTFTKNYIIKPTSINFLMNGIIEFLIDRLIAFETSRTFTLFLSSHGEDILRNWTNFQIFSFYNKFIIMNAKQNNSKLHSR